MSFWARIKGFFVADVPPIVRLANAIFLNALRNHATVVYIDREKGVRMKTGGETTVMFEPFERERMYEMVMARLQELAATDARTGTIRLRLGTTGDAEFEMRPYGRDGVVLTVEKNPYPK